VLNHWPQRSWADPGLGQPTFRDFDESGFAANSSRLVANPL
jgi:hypothetical protein